MQEIRSVTKKIFRQHKLVATSQKNQDSYQLTVPL